MIDLQEDKEHKIINPDDLDTDNGGKPMSTGGLGKSTQICWVPT